MKDLTIVVAVDKHYVKKLSLSWKTWMKFRPEMRTMPIVIIYDADQLDHKSKEFDEFKSHDKLVLYPWSMTGEKSQREKMLNSLVFAPGKAVETKWYLKLDADTYARFEQEWIFKEWFEPKDGAEPVFIASPWNYTKPGYVLPMMEDWADNTPQLKQYSRLNFTVKPGSDICVSRRMASWVMFASTDWTREVASYCKQLPYPSQDTYLYYCAARRRDFYRRVKMRKYGWGHFSRYNSLLSVCNKLIEDAEAVEVPND